MKKAVLLLIVVLGLGMLEPRTRARLTGLVRPLTEMGQRRAARRALDEIAGELERAAKDAEAVPDPAGFAGWLRRQDRSAADPWGSAYYLELRADSFVVGSAGPDGRRRTDDDLRRAARREAPATPEPGVLITDFEPAPPPSSTGRTAKTKAMEAAGRR